MDVLFVLSIVPFRQGFRHHITWNIVLMKQHTITIRAPFRTKNDRRNSEGTLHDRQYCSPSIMKFGWLKKEIQKTKFIYLGQTTSSKMMDPVCATVEFFLEVLACSLQRFCRSMGWTEWSSAERFWALPPLFHKTGGTHWHSVGREGLVANCRICTNTDRQTRACGIWKMCRRPWNQWKPSSWQSLSLSRWHRICGWRVTRCSVEMRTCLQLSPREHCLLPCRRISQVLWRGRQLGS